MLWTIRWFAEGRVESEGIGGSRINRHVKRQRNSVRNKLSALYECVFFTSHECQWRRQRVSLKHGIPVIELTSVLDAEAGVCPPKGFFGIDAEAMRVIRDADDIAARFRSHRENEVYRALTQGCLRLGSP